ncbi:hypothetical protein ACP4OV_031161 [Aristida adscensionis]
MRRGDHDPAAAAAARGSPRVAPAPGVERWAGCGIDDLPRDLLLRVLSRLGARQLVRTCAVAPRWRDLWRDARCINAVRREFGELNDSRDGRHEARDSKFQRFVSRLLMLRNPTALDQFRLWCAINPSKLEAYCAEANLWIGHALLCNARFVDVSVRHEEEDVNDMLELDPGVFTSENLTTLRLSGCYLTSDFLGRLRTGCVLLERLSLQNCYIAGVEISSQTLKFLTIGIDCYFASDTQTTISVPSLVHLGFFGSVTSRLPSLENMESLLTARVALGCFSATDTQVDDILVEDVCRFLQRLSGVTELDFYFEDISLKMENNLQWCPKFNNLAVLTLSGWCLHANFYALIVFLQNSPNLVKLILKLKRHSYERGRIMGELKERSFTCEQLKIVEIVCIERDPIVNSLEKFLLDSGITSCQIHIKN